jgi:hypothetical protein
MRRDAGNDFLFCCCHETESRTPIWREWDSHRERASEK